MARPKSSHSSANMNDFFPVLAEIWGKAPNERHHRGEEEGIMMLSQVKALTHQMRLFGLHEACERRAQEALAQQFHPLEFLRLLLEDEVLARKARTAKALATKARFRFRADLEDWDDTIPRGVPPAKIAELAQLSFLYNRENLLIIGKTGLGKTHLAIALGTRLCQEGHATHFLPIHFLFEEVLAARAAGRYLPYVKSLTKATVLIMDDFGLRHYTHDEAIALMDVLEERYRKGPVIMTSQVEPSGWLKLFEDAVIGEALVDRLIHPSQKLVLKGDRSYREILTNPRSDLRKTREVQ